MTPAGQQVVRYGLLWIGVAVGVALLILPHKMPRFLEIAHHPAVTTGVVTEIRTGRYPKIAYSYTADGVFRSGKDNTSDCGRFRIGEVIKVYYATTDPTKTMVGDPAAAVRGEALSILAASLIVPNIVVFQVWRSRRKADRERLSHAAEK